MTTTEQQPNPFWNERVASLLSHIFLLGMMITIAISAIQFGERLFRGWEGGFLIGMTIVVAIEGMLGKRLQVGINDFDVNWAIFRGAELVVLGITLRLWLYFLNGISQLSLDLSTYGFKFINYFSDPEFLAVMAFCLVIWVISTAFAGDLANLEGDITIVDQVSFRFEVQDRELARRRIVNRVFSVGIFLVILSAMVHADIGMIWQDLPTIQGGGVNIVIYFLLGLLLFSITQFSTLRALWIWDRIPVGQDIARNWILYGLIFLGGLGILVGFLPTRYSLGFLDMLTYLISIVANGLFYVFTFLWSLILLIWYFFSRIFSGAVGEENLPVQTSPQLTPPFADPLPPGTTFSPWQTFTSVIFWIIFLGVVYYAFYYFFRQHRERFAWVREIAFIREIRKGLGWLKDFLFGWNRAMLQIVQDGVSRIRATRMPGSGGRSKPIRLINPLRLPPRLRVIFFYLALVRRGGRGGLPRGSGETPYEYAKRLEAALEDVDSELNQMTEKFVLARYSQAEIVQEDAREVRNLWGKIQRAMRGRKP